MSRRELKRRVGKRVKEKEVFASLDESNLWVLLNYTAKNFQI